MPYTQAQLVAAYTAANDGVAPDSATTTLLGAFATQTQTGQLSDNAALAYVINSADKTTAVANIAYQFFTGKTPTKAGLDYLVNSTTNPTDLNDPYYAAFNIENRYMNFAANLGIVGDGATAFNTTYGTTAIPLFSTFIGVIYEQIIGSSYAAAAGINVTAAINDVIGRQAAFTQIARERGIITSTSTQAQIDLATRAVAVGYLMVEGIKADVGVYAAGSNNLVNAMINGTATYNVNLLTTYSPLGGGVGSPVSSSNPVTGGTPGSTLALTAGVDNLAGGPNDDTFNGNVVAQGTTAIFTTFSALDTVNGGGGNDTLNLLVTDASATATANATQTLPAAAVSNVENINVRIVDNTAAAPNVVTAVATNFAGALAFNNDRSVSTPGGAAAASQPTLNVTNLATGQAVGIVGLGGGTYVGGVSGNYGIGSSTGASNFNAIVNLTGGTGSGTAGATSNPAVTLSSATGSIRQVTINSNGSTANVIGNVQLDAQDTANTSGGTVNTLNIVANANLTAGAVTGFGGAAAGGTGTTTGTIAVSGNGNVTLGGVDSGFATQGAGTTSLNVLNITTGTGTLTTGAIGGVVANNAGLFNAAATINISGGATTATAQAAAVNIGAVTANVTTVNASGLTAGGVAATLGAAANQSFQGGAGTDIVTFAAGSGATFTGNVNGNGGTDIVAFTSGDLVANLTALVTNFETLRVSNNTGGALTFDPTLINGITSYQVAASTAGGSAVTLINMVANPSVTVIGNVTQGLTLNLAVANGATDVINLRLDNQLTTGTNTSGVAVGTIGGGGVGLSMGGSNTAGQVETLNVTSAGRIAGTGIYNQLTLNAGAGPNFVDANTVKVSGAAGLLITTGAVQHNQLIDASASTGGVNINNLTGVGAGGSFTIIGSAKNDTITSATTANIYMGGGGDDITLGAGSQIVTYKAASDSQLDLAGMSTAGAAGTTTPNAGTVGASNIVTASTSAMDVISGFATGGAGDKIDLTAFAFTGTGAGGIINKTTVATDAAFNTALTTAGLFTDGVNPRFFATITHTAATGGAGTFLVVDVNKDGAYTAGTDMVVKLLGVAAGALVIADFNL